MTNSIYINTEVQKNTEYFADWNILRKLIAMRTIMITHTHTIIHSPVP